LSSVAVNGGLAWFLKEWISERMKNAIKHEYDQKLEAHRARLKAVVDTEIETLKAKLEAENARAQEQLKADLQIAASEHQIRFEKLHEKVAQTVAGSYARLQALWDAVQNYTSILETASMGSKEDR